jgi:hypothetical protein
MEFSYKLTEAEYVLACRIAVKRPGRPWARLLSRSYLFLIFLVVWGSLLAGMVLEQSDLVGITADEIRHIHTVPEFIPESIIPAICLFVFVVLALGMRPLRWLDRKARQEHFRTDPSCQAETTVTATPNSISFRSVNGSSDSIWGCFATWAERNGILVLVTRAGVRKILKISGLTEPEKAEFRMILNAALPKN